MARNLSNLGGSLLSTSSSTLKKRKAGWRQYRAGLIYACLLTISILVFFDRGAFSALVVLIEDSCDSGQTSHCSHDLHMSKHDLGIVGGAFVGGFAVASVLLAQIARVVPHGIVMCVGLLIWACAEVGTAFSTSTAALICFRTLTGVGEAVFVPISSLLVQDIAPKGQTNLWLGIYFCTQALGFACGSILAGIVQDWKLVFLLEAAAMVPIAFASLFLPSARGAQKEAHLSTSSADGDAADAAGMAEEDAADDDAAGKAAAERIDVLGGEMPPRALEVGGRAQQMLRNVGAELGSSLADLARICTNPLFVCAVAGYTSVTFTLGALSFWMPAYEIELYGTTIELASASLGLSIIFSAVVSNVGVSLWLDLVTSLPAGVQARLSGGGSASAGVSAGDDDGEGDSAMLSESGDSSSSRQQHNGVGAAAAMEEALVRAGSDSDDADAGGDAGVDHDDAAGRAQNVAAAGGDGGREAEGEGGEESGATRSARCACDCCRLGLDPSFAAFAVGVFSVILSATFALLAATIPPTPLSGDASAAQRATAQTFFIGIIFIAVFWTLAASIVPAPIVILNAVEPHQRGIAMSFSVLIIHVLGDMWAPYVFGWLFECKCRLPLVVVVLWELGAIVTWGVGAFYAARKFHGGIRSLLARRRGAVMLV